MVPWYMQYNGHELTIIWAWPYGHRDFTFIYGLGSNGCFVMGIPCMDGVMVTVLLVAWATRGLTSSGY
jgi:hypothetical protein